MMFKRNIIFLLLFFCSFTNSQLRIEVTEGIKDPITIAIVPISWNLDTPPKLYLDQIISKDLESFGEFISLPPRNMLSFPNSEEEVLYRDWNLLGVDYLVIGSAVLGQDLQDVVVSFSIINITRQRVIKRSISKGSSSFLKSLGHVMSDRIYKEINGIPGIFSTKISYVNNESFPEKNYFLRVTDIDGENDSVLFSSPESI